jgi:hypothetical protein
LTARGEKRLCTVELRARPSDFSRNTLARLCELEIRQLSLRFRKID